jgi:hypothetical protein
MKEKMMVIEIFDDGPPDDFDGLVNAEELCYPVWLLLNIPPITNPLGDAEMWYGDGITSRIPVMHYELEEKEMKEIYKNLFRLLSNLKPLQRKFFLLTLSCNMNFTRCTEKDICFALSRYLPIEIRRDICKRAMNEDLELYLGKIGKFLVVKEETLLEIFPDRRGSELYRAYRIFLESNSRD